jgi:hypothetical protein
MDDITARKKAKELLSNFPNIEKTVKLQRLEGNKPPIGISIETNIIHESK